MKVDYLILTIYPILAIAMLFYKAKPASARDFYNPVQVGQTKALQAFACIGIILHHITQSITAYGEINKGPITILAQMGILFTSVFFFCSGYGLVFSIYNKPAYLRTFLYKRVFKVLIPFWSANVVFVLVNLAMHGKTFDNAKIVRYLSGLTLVNSNGWYIIEIVALYLAFFAIFGLVRNKDIALILMCTFTVWLIIFAKGRGRDNSLTDVNGSWFRGEWWYNSTIVFVLGMLLARFGSQLVCIIKRHYKMYIVVFAISFVIVFGIEEIIRRSFGYYRESAVIDRISNSSITLVSQILLCIVWMCLLILVCMKVKFENRILSFIGGISVELFLTHKLFIEKFFTHTAMRDYVRYPLVIVCSIITASMMSYINKGIYILLRLDGSAKNLPNKINSEKSIADDVADDAVGDVADLEISEAEISSEEPADLIAYKKSLARAGRRKYVIAYTFAAIIAICALYALISKTVTAKRDYKTSVNQLTNASAGDIVTFGRFDTSKGVGKEKVTWVVLGIDGTSDGKYVYTLATAEVIAGGAYNRKHEKTSWKKSDLRDILNSPDYLDMFSKYDRKLLKPDENGDLISIMSVSEALRYYEDDELRKLTGCEVAIASGLNINTLSKVNQWDYKQVKTSWWWLSPDDISVENMEAPIVSVEGTVEETGKFVNKPTGGIRPVVRVVIEKD